VNYLSLNSSPFGLVPREKFPDSLLSFLGISPQAGSHWKLSRKGTSCLRIKKAFLFFNTKYYYPLIILEFPYYNRYLTFPYYNRRLVFSDCSRYLIFLNYNRYLVFIITDNNLQGLRFLFSGKKFHFKKILVFHFSVSPFTTITGVFECLTTFSATLPSRNLSNPVLPSVPITIRSMSSCSANSIILFAG